MRDETILCSLAVICITIIELMALYSGIDGQLLISVLATLSGIVGYFFGKKLEKDKFIKANSY